MQTIYEKMKNKDINELKEKIQNAIDTAIMSEDNPLIQTLLTFAPIKVTKPHPEFTAGIGKDYYIYINPVFWNYIYQTSNEMNIEPVYKQYTAIIMHEMLHATQRHPDEISVTVNDNNKEIEYRIANILTDFCINKEIIRSYLQNDRNIIHATGIDTFNKVKEGLEYCGIGDKGIQALQGYIDKKK